MDLQLAGQLLGGLGIILLGMEMLTQGLKSAAGPSLRTVISRATQSRPRAFTTGIAVTGLVQSSSAVALATLGFVSAGLMTLGQALPLLFGSNIGTTLTGWLVALLGFKLKISEFMLPLIGIGIGMKLFAPGRATAQYGIALAGFGLFFFGLDFIRLGFDGMSDALPLKEFGSGPLSLILFLFGGLFITLLTQSSSASMAIALSMIATDTIGFSAGCALVVGANIGTTTTAIIGAIGSTPNAKRIALAHLVFNSQTAVLGILLLMLVANQIDEYVFEWIDPVLALALFHTLFNLVGVLLIWPMTDRLEAWLSRRFVAKAEEDAKPQYIGKPLLVAPMLAVEGINRELARANKQSSDLARAALSSEGEDQETMLRARDSVNLLLQQIYSFNQQLARQDITEEIAETLPVSLRVGRYLNEMARIAADLPRYQPLLNRVMEPGIAHSIDQFKKSCVELIDACEVSTNTDIQGIDAHKRMRALKSDYQNLKHEVLNKTVQGLIASEDSAELLEYLSQIRRLADQAEDVSSHWSTTLPLQRRDKLADETHPG